jgi:hypothetical protein
LVERNSFRSILRPPHHGSGHDAPEVRTTFLILHGPAVARGELEGKTANEDVAPTVLAHLRVPLRSEWRLDGNALNQPRL